MRPGSLLIALIVLLTLAGNDCSAALPMRPYSGIGVLCIVDDSPDNDLQLYEEPGLVRSGTLNAAAARQLTAWLLNSGDALCLLVTARKGEWLRIERDDAGRQAWLRTMRRWSYTPWDQFLKGRQISFLRNAPRQQLQVYPYPETANGTPLLSFKPMKVIMVQGDWTYVLYDQLSAGWIRWRDHDGRLLVGLTPSLTPESR